MITQHCEQRSGSPSTLGFARVCRVRLVGVDASEAAVPFACFRAVYELPNAVDGCAQDSTGRSRPISDAMLAVWCRAETSRRVNRTYQFDVFTIVLELLLMSAVCAIAHATKGCLMLCEGWGYPFLEMSVWELMSQTL